tara:strand:+ start:476 stop:1051 length:576 start_codon:yes stop_codon:yes gene_type:complete
MDDEYIKKVDKLLTKNYNDHMMKVDKKNKVIFYAENIVFWLFEKKKIIDGEIKFENELKRNIYYGMCLGGYKNTMEKIENITKKREIMTKANELFESKQKITKLYRIAFELFEKAVEKTKSSLDIILVNPINWLSSQDKMRKVWKKMDKNETDEFSEYMRFMYKNFPCGFGEEVKNGISSEIVYNKLKFGL